MKKAIFIITTVFIMLITSRFVIRIVDATVQIDNDIALRIILLIVLNVVIGMLSRFLYKKIFRENRFVTAEGNCHYPLHFLSVNQEEMFQFDCGFPKDK